MARLGRAALAAVLPGSGSGGSGSGAYTAAGAAPGSAASSRSRPPGAARPRAGGALLAQPAPNSAGGDGLGQSAPAAARARPMSGGGRRDRGVPAGRAARGHGRREGGAGAGPTGAGKRALETGGKVGDGGGRECPRAGAGPPLVPALRPARGACGTARALPPTAARVRAREHRRSRGFPPPAASSPVGGKRPCSRGLPPPAAVEVLRAAYDREGVGACPATALLCRMKDLGSQIALNPLPKSMKGQCSGSLDPLVLEGLPWASPECSS